MLNTVAKFAMPTTLAIQPKGNYTSSEPDDKTI